MSAFLAALRIVEHETSKTAIAAYCGLFRNCRAGDTNACIFEALQELFPPHRRLDRRRRRRAAPVVLQLFTHNGVRSINESRFDTLSRTLAGGLLRRRAIGKAIVLLAVTAALPRDARACKKVGKKCDTNNDCCD